MEVQEDPNNFVAPAVVPEWVTSPCHHYYMQSMFSLVWETTCRYFTSPWRLEGPSQAIEFGHCVVHQDNISRPSSCRSVLVDGRETGVHYWQCDIKGVVQQYQLKFPDGVKKSYIYARVPKNFRSKSMLAGLCNLCDDFGHSNFDYLMSLLDDLNNQGVLNTSYPQQVPKISKDEI